MVMLSSSGLEPASGVARQWWERVGDGWPAGLDPDDPQVAPLFETLGEGVAASLDAETSSGVAHAFQDFRQAFAPIWRGKRS